MQVVRQDTGVVKDDLRAALEREHFPHVGPMGYSAMKPRLDRLFEIAWERGEGEPSRVSAEYPYYAFLVKG
jgi:hypothetical protein